MCLDSGTQIMVSLCLHLPSAWLVLLTGSLHPLAVRWVTLVSGSCPHSSKTSGKQGESLFLKSCSKCDKTVYPWLCLGHLSILEPITTNKINANCTLLTEKEGEQVLQRQTPYIEKKRWQTHGESRNAIAPPWRILCFNTMIQINHPILGCLWIPWSLSTDPILGREDSKA